MRDGWLKLTLDKAIGPKGKIIGGPFGSDLTQGDYVEAGVPVIRVANQVGPVVSGDFVFISEEKAQKLKANIAKPGDIIVVQRGSTYGKVSRIPYRTDFDKYVVCQSQMAISIDESVSSPEFFFQVLRSQVFARFLSSEVIQTGQPHINLGILKRARIPVPPLPEQRKIAEILQTWDEAIEKLEALQAAKERRLGTLRDALLFERLRVGKSRRNRPLRRISEVTHELTARNGEGAFSRAVVMGVTNSRGIVPMREQTVADDIGRYKQLPPRAFAYNPMRINVGSIAMNEGERTVLVSPDYVVFACKEDGMAPDYLDHLRQTRWWLHHINSGGSGSVRQRTYYDDLAALHLPLPDLNEQRAIVVILNAAKADLSATDHLKISLIQQKRGLMQKLLTGEWPVDVIAPDMEAAE